MKNEQMINNVLDTNNASNGTVEISNATFTKVHEFTLGKGKWLVIFNCPFAPNATGRRILQVNTTGTTPTGIGGRDQYVSYSAVDGSYAHTQLIRAFNFSSETTVYMYAYQNSGGALNTYPQHIALKLE